MRGAILQQVDPDQASQDYTKCIELQPDNAAFYYARGTLLNNLSENERALQDFGKAIELNPLYVEAHNNKGLIYLETN
jgi:tetratricopeptide (TPR) repeat protein